MRKKSNMEEKPFAHHTRQSYVAILLIIYRTYQVLFRQALPFLVVIFFGGKSTQSKLFIGLGIAAAIGTIFSIIKFFRYYFYIENDELIIEQGVLNRSKTNVPFDRIQTINFEQNIIHRIFNVVMLKVDTAGSADNELTFQAIDHQTANQLRDILLSKRKKRSTTTNLIADESPTNKSQYKTIMQLDVASLLKAGMVENHLRSGGFIFAFLFWIWQGASEIGMEDVVEGEVSKIEYGLTLVGILLILFIVFSFLISLVRMIIKNYDLQFLRSEHGFKINAGLFTKRDISALDHKIQVLSWADNPLKKLINIKDLRLRQAGSKTVNVSKSIKIPGCTLENIQLVTSSLYGPHALSGIDFKHIHPSYFHRIALYVLTAGLALWSLFYYLDNTNMIIFVTFVTLAILVTRYLSMTKKTYGYNEEMLVINGGSYGDKTEVLPIYKIQSFTKTSSPYQRRKDLCSLTLHTASGRVGIPYIPQSDATSIVDELLYKVEVDHRPWM